MLAEIANLKKQIISRFSGIFAGCRSRNFSELQVNEILQNVARLLQAQLQSRQKASCHRMPGCELAEDLAAGCGGPRTAPYARFQTWCLTRWTQCRREARSPCVTRDSSGDRAVVENCRTPAPD